MKNFSNKFFIKSLFDIDIDFREDQKIIKAILKIYSKLLIKHLNIDDKFAYHFIKQQGNFAICEILTVLKAFNLSKSSFNKKKSADHTFKYDLNREAFFFQDFGQSYTEKFYILNNILDIFGYEKVSMEFDEPKELKIEDLKLRIKKFQKYFFYKAKLKKIKNRVLSYSKFFFNEIFCKKELRIGYKEKLKTKEFLYQLKKIKFIKFDNIEMPIIQQNSKNYFCEKYKNNFLNEANNLEYFNYITNENEKLLILEFIFFHITFHLDSLLFSNKDFNQVLNNFSQKLKNNKIDIFIFIEHCVYEFDDILISLACKKNGIKTITKNYTGSILLDHGEFYNIDEMNNCFYSITDFYIGHEIFEENIIDKTQYLKKPNPSFFYYRDGYKKKNKANKKIVYSPGKARSSIFDIEYFPQPFHKKYQFWLQDIINLLDEKYSKTIDLSIKIKAFNYRLYENYEYRVVKKLNFKNINPTYLTLGTLEDWTNFFDLHITDSLSTAFSHSINYNIPTIGLINLEGFKIKKKFEPIYKKIKAVGLICENKNDFEISLYNFLENDYWFSEEFQNVRKEFLDVFAYSNKNWNKQLEDFFIDLNKN